MGKFEDDGGKSASRGGGRGLSRFVITVLVIAAILMVTLVFAVKTEGGRSFVQSWLARQLGMELTIDGARIGFPFALVIEDVVSKAAEPGGKPILKAQEISIAPGMRGGWELSIRRGALNLMKTDSGDWNPAIFSRLGDVASRNIAEVSRVMRNVGKNMSLHISESTINWMSSSGAIIAGVNGLALDVTPIELPSRHMQHFRLSVYSAHDADGLIVNDIEREWLSCDTKDYLEIFRSDTAKGGAVPKFLETEKPEKPQKEPELLPKPDAKGLDSQ
jgi:hypothetical protein